MADAIITEFLKYRRVISSLLSAIRPRASVQDIEDILQDTYINTYQSSLKKNISFPKAYMVKTAIRLANRQIEVAQRLECDDSIEQKSDETAAIYDSIKFDSQTEQAAVNQEEFCSLCHAVNELPEQCRRVFILKKVYGLSQRDIAEKLGISESTVEKHVAKGLLRTLEFYTALQENTAGNADNIRKLDATRTRRHSGRSSV
ncbi:MAG: RNA polymerase sigma factor [Gammaproteobacteria bacterium]